MVQELYRIGSKVGIQPFEFVRGVFLEHRPFTLENGLLTGASLRLLFLIVFLKAIQQQQANAHPSLVRCCSSFFFRCVL